MHWSCLTVTQAVFTSEMIQDIIPLAANAILILGQGKPWFSPAKIIVWNKRHNWNSFWMVIKTDGSYPIQFVTECIKLLFLALDRSYS